MWPKHPFILKMQMQSKSAGKYVVKKHKDKYRVYFVQDIGAEYSWDKDSTWKSKKRAKQRAEKLNSKL